MKEYWQNIAIASKTLKEGLKLTVRHMKNATTAREPIAPSSDNYFEKENALFTVQYPKEVLPVPAIGRYKLHNEIDDCIVCDKCAKVCPVDCIEIEPVRAVEEIGKTSDGTSKRIYAAKFDIDMAKCCFCGLCTTVCPTECLTMSDDYDFSTYDIKEHNFPFATMTPVEILEKKKELEAFNKKKEEDKKSKLSASDKPASIAKPKVSAGKPVFKPKVSPGVSKPKMSMKPKVPGPKVTGDQEASNLKKDAPVSAIKPKVPGKSAKPKVVIRPKMDKSSKKPEDSQPKSQVKPKKDQETASDQERILKAKVKPKVPIKPRIPPRKEEEE